MERQEEDGLLELEVRRERRRSIALASSGAASSSAAATSFAARQLAVLLRISVPRCLSASQALDYRHAPMRGIALVGVQVHALQAIGSVRSAPDGECMASCVWLPRRRRCQGTVVVLSRSGRTHPGDRRRAGPSRARTGEPAQAGYQVETAGVRPPQARAAAPQQARPRDPRSDAPDIPGTEVCRQLRASERTRTVPVIMLTARGEELDRVVGFEVGADDYVTKPPVRELTLRVAVLQRKPRARGGRQARAWGLARSRAPPLFVAGRCSSPK
jgi:CheY-like chemotaxis protein